MSTNNTTHVFLLHGLGEHSVTMWPLMKYLNYCGFKNTYNLKYPSDSLEFDETLDFVDELMSKSANKDEDEVILIGMSMGGLVSNNMHTKGWTIKNAIYIGSPLHGASLLNQMESILPTTIRDYFYKTPYDFLKNKEKEVEPPHSYHCITMGLFDTEFDGCLYKEESVLDEKHHTHLRYTAHPTIFANPRLWTVIENLLSSA